MVNGKIEMSKVRFTAIIFFIILASCMGTYAFIDYLWVTKLHQNPTLRANVLFIFERAGATESFMSGNVITNIGENYTRCAFSRGGTWLEIQYISIGNATAAPTLTQLTSEYSRQQGTITEWINGGDYAFNVTYTWTFTATVNINAAGAHWESTGNGNMYAVANFPSAQTFNANDNCTVRWIFTYDAN